MDAFVTIKRIEHKIWAFHCSDKSIVPAEYLCTFVGVIELLSKESGAFLKESPEVFIPASEPCAVQLWTAAV
jgi:hypothetical protein